MCIRDRSDVVIDKFGNTARSDGLNDSKIRGHIRNIKNGKYLPKHHPPILVEPIFIDGELKFKIINGHHRYQAHLGAKSEFIYVAIGVFNDADGESAESALIYLTIYLALFILGPGRYSLDQSLMSSKTF